MRRREVSESLKTRAESSNRSRNSGASRSVCLRQASTPARHRGSGFRRSCTGAMETAGPRSTRTLRRRCSRRGPACTDGNARGRRARSARNCRVRPATIPNTRACCCPPAARNSRSSRSRWASAANRLPCRSAIAPRSARCSSAECPLPAHSQSTRSEDRRWAGSQRAATSDRTDGSSNNRRYPDPHRDRSSNPGDSGDRSGRSYRRERSLRCRHKRPGTRDLLRRRCRRRRCRDSPRNRTFDLYRRRPCTLLAPDRSGRRTRARRLPPKSRRFQCCTPHRHHPPRRQSPRLPKARRHTSSAREHLRPHTQRSKSNARISALGFSHVQSVEEKELGFGKASRTRGIIIAEP